jgi:hypothetical protein
MTMKDRLIELILEILETKDVSPYDGRSILEPGLKKLTLKELTALSRSVNRLQHAIKDLTEERQKLRLIANDMAKLFGIGGI